MATSRFLIIGGGTMARAITDGALRAGFDASRFVVAEPDPGRREPFGARAIRTFARAADALRAREPDDQVLLAVKPQSLDDVARDLRPFALSGVVISILAGTPTARIRSALGDRARIIRVMPNTPARIGLGCTALAPGAGASPGDADAARELFATLGMVLDLEEDLFDAFTALAGSGPAYLFFLAEAMVRAGVAAGMSGALADRAVRQTLLGAAALLSQSPDAPGALRAGVTSPGGTTEAAVRVLNESGVPDALVRAILAARDRGRELWA